MEHVRLYLADILEASDRINRFIAGHDAAIFIIDELAQSAVAFQLSIIGEATRRLPDDLKQRYPTVAWQDARSMRNLIAHQYFAIDWMTVWDTVASDIPALRQQVATIVATEFPDT
jgi:uncharacterized protein with HEPN domain